MTTTRRTVLLGGLAAGGLASGGAWWAPDGSALPPVDRRPTAAAPPLARSPFRLGVASGDPSPSGFVIWTRLAPRPLARDGHGGMPDRAYAVHWQVARDARFTRVVRRGTTLAYYGSAHSVHVEVTGLGPGREYYYRFRVDGHVSRRGRARTAPRGDAMPRQLRVAAVSCANYEHGYFTAYRRLANGHPDLVLCLGDYLYDTGAGQYVAPGGNVRRHAGPETRTLAGYRRRYAQYKTDPDLQAAHATAPWLAVWDDHEVDNNWAGPVPSDDQSPAAFRDRRRAAFRAWYENMPVRRSARPHGAELQLFRRVRWGRLASFHLLDTRQYRDDQACGDGFVRDCGPADATRRTITGGPQETWLLNGLHRSPARWDLLAQQVFFGRRDADPGSARLTLMDAWDGYLGSRRRVLRGLAETGARNPVVLTGDVHSHWAGELVERFDDPDSRPLAVELVTSSISSGGDGFDSASGEHPWFEENPHLKFWTNLRGYLTATITPERIDADFRAVRRVSRRGAGAFTRRSYAVLDRDHRLHRTADDPAVDRAFDPRTLPPDALSRLTMAAETADP